MAYAWFPLINCEAQALHIPLQQRRIYVTPPLTVCLVLPAQWGRLEHNNSKAGGLSPQTSSTSVATYMYLTVRDCLLLIHGASMCNSTLKYDTAHQNSIQQQKTQSVTTPGFVIEHVALSMFQTSEKSVSVVLQGPAHMHAAQSLTSFVVSHRTILEKWLLSMGKCLGSSLVVV